MWFNICGWLHVSQFIHFIYNHFLYVQKQTLSQHKNYNSTFNVESIFTIRNKHPSFNSLITDGFCILAANKLPPFNQPIISVLYCSIRNVIQIFKALS